MLFPIAAGNWNNASNAGIFYRNWNNNRSNDNNNIGFRVCDYIIKANICFNSIGVVLSCTMAKYAWNNFLVLIRNISYA